MQLQCLVTHIRMHLGCVFLKPDNNYDVPLPRIQSATKSNRLNEKPCYEKLSWIPIIILFFKENYTLKVPKWIW